MAESKDILKEMLKWLKFTGLQEAKKVIEDALSHKNEEKENELRIAYELTDGSHSTTDIASMISVSHMTVSNWQNKWSKLGIVEKEFENSSYEHLISLEDAGLKCPDIPNPKEEDEAGGTNE